MYGPYGTAQAVAADWRQGGHTHTMSIVWKGGTAHRPYGYLVRPCNGG